MRKASDFDDIACFIQMLVDRMRVGDQETFIACEQLVDSRGVVLWRITEQGVFLGHDAKKEMGGAAFCSACTKTPVASNHR